MCTYVLLGRILYLEITILPSVAQYTDEVVKSNICTIFKPTSAFTNAITNLQIVLIFFS